jgi:hypothetical protein
MCESALNMCESTLTILHKIKQRASTRNGLVRFINNLVTTNRFKISTNLNMNYGWNYFPEI